MEAQDLNGLVSPGANPGSTLIIVMNVAYTVVGAVMAVVYGTAAFNGIKIKFGK